MIRASLDTLSNERATGWLYSDADSTPLSVEASINDQVIGHTVASLLRPDLKAAGFGDGRCGFEITFNSKVDPIYLPFVQVRLAGSDLEIRRWMGAGFRDYFTAFYQRYPRASRSASVFGSLWTDRSDAPSRIKGRLDVGLLAPSEANHLARFIQDGVLLLATGAPTEGKRSNGGSASGPLGDLVARNFFGEQILSMMRAILEDHPVAVRADVPDSDPAFLQMSALEELPSPGECLGLVFPKTEASIAVEVVREGHRLPEFLPDGMSRWIRAAGTRTAESVVSGDLPADRYEVRGGSALLIGPGALCRVHAPAGGAVRVLALPARQSLLRFQQGAPRGEVAHASGARVWV